MQTFMPYSDFAETARILDYRRLGKQRLEALDIYRINTGRPVGASEKQMAYLAKRYGNHPIVKLWKGYELALLLYGITICREWASRGYVDNMEGLFEEELERFVGQKIIYPDWTSNFKLNISHKSNLVRKFPEHYRKFFPNVRDDLSYEWLREEERRA